MGVKKVTTVLEKNRGVWMTTQQIVDSVHNLSARGVKRVLSGLHKRSGYEISYVHIDLDNKSCVRTLYRAVKEQENK